MSKYYLKKTKSHFVNSCHCEDTSHSEQTCHAELGSASKNYRSRNQFGMTCNEKRKAAHSFAKSAFLDFAASRASFSLRPAGCRSNCPHVLEFRTKGAHSFAKSAFSLVEAMIILVLISVAIMALIPLLNAKKTAVPKWSPIKNDAKQIVGTYYGIKPSERVGLGNTNPYDENINAKFALPKLMLKGTTDLSSILWGNNFINSAYSNKAAVRTEAIELGMNACHETAYSEKTVIRSGGAVAAVGDIPDCSGLFNFVNIGNKIIASSNSAVALRISDITDGINAEDLLKNDNGTMIYIRPDSSSKHDIFEFKYPNGDVAMSYSSGTLNVAPNMIVNGNLFLAGYNVSNGDNSASNIQCDIDADTGECTRISDYVNKYQVQGSGVTFGTSAAGENIWGNRFSPSDIRLKNILSSYVKGIKDISKVDTYLYTFKSDKKQQIHAGILAQKLIGVFDEALHKDSKGYYSYDRNPMLYAMTNSAKEINEKQDELSKKQKDMNNEADKLIRMYK